MNIKLENAKHSRLRFVFPDAVVSAGFPADATLGDVARSLDALQQQRMETPIAIDVTLAAQ